MSTRLGPGVVNQDRLLITTATGIAAAVAVATVLATSALPKREEIRDPSPYVAIQNEPAPKLIVAAQNVTSADRSNTILRRSDGTAFPLRDAGPAIRCC